MRRYSMSPALREQVTIVIWGAPLFLGLLVFAGFYSPGARTETAYWLLVAGAALGTLFGFWANSALNATLELSDDGITDRRGKRVTTIRWHDVERLEYRRFAQRLLVIAANGERIPVEKQFAGFDEIRDTIRRRTGREIAHDAPHSPSAGAAAAPRYGVIAPTLLVRVLYVVLVAVCTWCFFVSFLIVAWRDRAPRWLLAAAIGGWLVTLAARGFWRQLGVRLAVTDDAIRFTERNGETLIRWSEIGSAAMDHETGVPLLVIRDRNGEVLLVLERRIFDWSNTAMRRYDAFAAEMIERFPPH